MIYIKNKNLIAFKFLIITLISITVVIFGVALGSVYITPISTISIIIYKLFNYSFIPIEDISNTSISIIWNIRLPRVLLAFITGGGLAFSGAIMQSILKNPLASSYTLGVSSGAGLGASFSILFNIYIFGIFTLPIFGFTSGVITVILAVLLATKMDKGIINNNTIILTGMAFSLFADSIMSILMAFKKESLQNLIFWQMGHFGSKDSRYLYILYPSVIIIFLLVILKHIELDILTFGDEQASVTGVDVSNTKWYLIILSAITSGIIISISGIIGFIDLFVPHIARSIFGTKHRYILPACFILGGAFMVVCDLIARTIVAPAELPVGSITAFIGAPFFIYVYIKSKK
ncbi:MAG: iron ABC transporter permease [bacterium]